MKRDLSMRFVTPALLCTAAILLSGCEGVRKTLGLDKDPPDEFAVYKRAPIVVPPGFGAIPDNTLPTPDVSSSAYQDSSDDVMGIEDVRPHEITPNAQAQKSILGQVLPERPQPVKNNVSKGEKAFIILLERELPPVAERPKDIRTTLDNETRIKTNTKKTLLQKLLFWQKEKPHTKEALKPNEEYERLHGVLPGEEGIAY